MKNKTHKAVIMDRDGTIFKERHYLSDPSNMEVFKGVFPALKRLKSLGWKLIIGTNQSGIGRGYFALSDMQKVHAAFLRLCRKNKLKIDEIYFCPHHPQAGCKCRKPEIGMLLKAKRKFNLDLPRCVVIGDKVSDVEWGERAGTRTILVLTGYGRKHKLLLKRPASYIARTFADAAQWILNKDEKENYDE